MKTILYQPLFINPQAYFVFPQLYHIEKGDSYIEPANITGQLIINTLTDDPTLTPTILTIKDNNQVDFSIFAGKHIRISQYTNIGAVDNGVFMSKALEQNGAFILEYKQGDKWNTYSYYSATNINIDKDNSIVYQTKNKYNEQTIYPGDKQDTDTLFIGTIRKDDSRSFIGCHGDILIFNRTLTEYELSWVKNNMMCSKQQEPDIDL